MIRKKPAPHLMRGGYRFSEKIMLNPAKRATIGAIFALRALTGIGGRFRFRAKLIKP
jgi:hypothetical protein